MARLVTGSPAVDGGLMRCAVGAAWQRNRMVKAGLLKPYERHGDPWALTEAGWAAQRALGSGAS
ncbi:hypothetical protein [Streptomyces sp. NPDC006477]|uniref:hypothetical protein n=1 Tax=Streptomyces sp. NPDC006477 TaxID=3364747 RepID=UPI003677EAE9